MIWGAGGDAKAELVELGEVPDITAEWETLEYFIRYDRPMYFCSKSSLSSVSLTVTEMVPSVLMNS